MKQDFPNTTRRHFLAVASASTAAALLSTRKVVAEDAYAIPRNGESPATLPSLQLRSSDTAVVFIDPQNDVLSEKGLAWPTVRESVKENNTLQTLYRRWKDNCRVASPGMGSADE